MRIFKHTDTDKNIDPWLHAIFESLKGVFAHIPDISKDTNIMDKGSYDKGVYDGLCLAYDIINHQIGIADDYQKQKLQKLGNSF